MVSSEQSRFSPTPPCACSLPMQRIAESTWASELEEVRKQVFELKAERDAALVQREEAIRNVRILKEEQESLQAEVKVHERKRKDSLRTLSRSLSDIGAQLDSAQASWTPKQQIDDTRKRVNTLQKDFFHEEDETDMLCGA